MLIITYYLIGGNIKIYIINKEYLSIKSI
jgi:hypothetical protein